MDNRALYTISNKWIMRHDEYYGNLYALYNIETRKLARLTASLYTLLHLFYTNARAYEDVKNSLAEQGVNLKWDNVSQIEKSLGSSSCLSKVKSHIIQRIVFRTFMLLSKFL